MVSKGAGLGLILASENVSPLGCFVGEGGISRLLYDSKMEQGGDSASVAWTT